MREVAPRPGVSCGWCRLLRHQGRASWLAAMQYLAVRSRAGYGAFQGGQRVRRRRGPRDVIAAHPDRGAARRRRKTASPSSTRPTWPLADRSGRCGRALVKNSGTVIDVVGAQCELPRRRRHASPPGPDLEAVTLVAMSAGWARASSPASSSVGQLKPSSTTSFTACFRLRQRYTERGQGKTSPVAS